MQKIRIIVEAEIDEKTMQDCGCNTTDILNGLLICDSYEADGFIITTSIRGCDNTSDFFLRNGVIKNAELIYERIDIIRYIAEKIYKEFCFDNEEDEKPITDIMKDEENKNE